MGFATFRLLRNRQQSAAKREEAKVETKVEPKAEAKKVESKVETSAPEKEVKADKADSKK